MLAPPVFPADKAHDFHDVREQVGERDKHSGKAQVFMMTDILFMLVRPKFFMEIEKCVPKEESQRRV